MTYDSFKHHRRSIRLKGYNYAGPGAYFVTMRAQNPEWFFGEIVNGVMELNDPGRMIEKWYLKLADKYPTVQCGEYVVMPDHFHAIIIIVEVDPTIGVNPTVGVDRTVGPNQTVGADPRICPRPDIITPEKSSECERFGAKGEHMGSPRQRQRTSLSTVMQWFKTMTTNEYIRGVKNDSWKPFNRRLWQRDYYEHIIRDQGEFDRIRQYIIYNPMNWDKDINQI